MTARPTPGNFRLEIKDDSAALNPVVKASLDAFGKAVEEFKTTNDARLGAAEKKLGSVDVLIDEKTARLNDALDQIKKDINAELAALKRPQHGADEAKANPSLAEFKGMAASRGVTYADDATALAAQTAYKSAFQSYLRKGQDGLSYDERKELSVGVAQEGGFLVMPERASRIITKIFETTPMRGLAGQMTIGTDRLILPVDRDEASSGWVGEQSLRPETDTPEVGEMEIGVHEQYAMPQITQNMIDDSSIDIEAWLDRKVTDKLIRTENTAFITGDGVKKPRGILGYTNVATADATRTWGQLEYVASGASGAFLAAASFPADKLLDLIYAIKPGYRQGAAWLGARATIGAVRKLKDGQGNYLAGARLQDGAFVENIFGFRVTEGEDMPALAANSYSLAFGNFSEGYLIVDRQGIRQLRDPYTTKGKVKVYTTKRVGGAVVNFDAIKLMKFATS